MNLIKYSCINAISYRFETLFLSMITVTTLVFCLKNKPNFKDNETPPIFLVHDITPTSINEMLTVKTGVHFFVYLRPPNGITIRRNLIFSILGPFRPIYRLYIDVGD